MKNWTPADLASRAATLRHEAAHIATAIHVRAWIMRVEIRSPRTTHRYAGRVEVDAASSWAHGIISLAGYVWEATHETGIPQTVDLNDAKYYAREGLFSFDDADRYVRAFLHDQESNVRDLAARIERDLPCTGLLKGRTLERIVTDFQRRLPLRDRHEMMTLDVRPAGEPMKVLVYDSAGRSPVARTQAAPRAVQSSVPPPRTSGQCSTARTHPG